MSCWDDKPIRRSHRSYTRSPCQVDLLEKHNERLLEGGVQGDGKLPRYQLLDVSHGASVSGDDIFGRAFFISNSSLLNVLLAGKFEEKSVKV